MREIRGPLVLFTVMLAIVLLIIAFLFFGDRSDSSARFRPPAQAVS